MASAPVALRRLALAAIALPTALAGAAPPALADGEPEAVPAAPVASIAFTAPAPGGALGAGVTMQVAALITGDPRVVSIHLDRAVPLCVFTRAHDVYSCPWTPTARDIGRHVLQARVQTTDGQSALVELPVVVGRLLPAAVGASTTRSRLRGGDWRLTTTGTVGVPTGLTAAACGGRATVTVLRGAHTVVDRSVPVAADCTFASRVTIAARRGTRAVRVKVAYGGAQLLAPRSAAAQTLALR